MRLAPPRRRARAFTLVELLVVIGIIAVLISVLLPALSAARKQAQAVRCAAHLREIGNAFKIYEVESKGYWPVARINGWREQNNSIGPYNIDGVNYPMTVPGYPTPQQGYWFNLLAKYVTKSKVGAAVGTNASDAGIARQSLFYSCPSWEGFQSGGLIVGEANVVQPGYGMNPYPSYREGYPPSWYSFDTPPVNPVNRPVEYAVHDPNDYQAGTPERRPGNFLKAKAWTRPSERMLIGDSRFWLAQANRPPAASSYPPAVVMQYYLANSSEAVVGAGVTTIDLYRHGKMPKVVSGAYLDPRGGKIAFNILYCDGHVATATEGREAYKSLRMKFPG